MLVFRITHKSYSSSLYASGMAGRWNGAGKKVIYAAESIALAFIENMIRRQGVGFKNDFRIMVVDIPGTITVSSVEVSSLPKGWRAFNSYAACQAIGNKWYDERETCVLKVPSAVLAEASNFVINSEHNDFDNIKLLETTELIPDERIEEILRKYKK